MPSHIPTPPRPPKDGWSADDGRPRAASVEQHTRFRPTEAVDVERMATWVGLTSDDRAARDRTKSSDQAISDGYWPLSKSRTFSCKELSID